MTQSVTLNSKQQQKYDLIQRAETGDENAIDELCYSIYDATAGRWGTDEETVSTILEYSSAETKAKVMERYTQVTGSEIYKDIQNDYSGNTETKILAALSSAYLEVNGEKYTGDNDGKLSIQQTAIAVGKGLMSPITSALKNPVMSALAIIGGAALIAVTGGAAAPFLVGMGVAAGGIQVGIGTYNAITAKTDDQASQGFESIGAGASSLALSVWRAKSSLASARNAGVTSAEDTESLNALQATLKCIEIGPESLTVSVNNIGTNVAALASSFNNFPPMGGSPQVCLAGVGECTGGTAIEGAVVVEGTTIAEGGLLSGVFFAKKKASTHRPSKPPVNKKSSSNRNHRDLVDHVKNTHVRQCEDGTYEIYGTHCKESYTFDNDGVGHITIDGHNFELEPTSTLGIYKQYYIDTNGNKIYKGFKSLDSVTNIDHILSLLDPNNTTVSLQTNQDGLFRYNGNLYKLVNDVTFEIVSERTYGGINNHGGSIPRIH